MTTSVKKESKLLAKHSLIYGLGTMVNRIVAFMLLPIYTRYLTPHDYGIKELVGLSTDVISILLATSISSAIYRFYFEFEDLWDKNEVISTAIITLGGLGLVVISLLWFFTRTMATYILDDPGLSHFFSISLATMWFQAMNDIGNSYLRANQKSLKFVLFSAVKLVLAISLNIYFIVFLGYGVLGVLLSSLISAVFLSLILTGPVLKKVGLHFSMSKLKEMLKFGLPMIPSQLGAFVVHLSDRFFLKAYTSIADTGLYSLGYRLGALPSNFISHPFNQTWQPRRFELYKKPESEKIFGTIFTYFLVLMFWAGLAVAILSKDILMIMADESYWSAYRIVPLIVLATTIFSFHYHLNMGILISKKTKYLAYINFSNGALILVLNFLLIPTYGVFGAAYATIAAFIYKVSLTYYFSSRYYKIHFELTRILKIVISVALLYFASLYVNLNTMAGNFAVKTGIIGLYPLLLFLFAFFTDAERKKIVEYRERFLPIFKRKKNGSI